MLRYYRIALMLSVIHGHIPPLPIWDPSVRINYSSNVLVYLISCFVTSPNPFRSRPRTEHDERGKKRSKSDDSPRRPPPLPSPFVAQRAQQACSLNKILLHRNALFYPIFNSHPVPWLKSAPISARTTPSGWRSTRPSYPVKASFSQITSTPPFWYPGLLADYSFSVRGIHSSGRGFSWRDIRLWKKGGFGLAYSLYVLGVGRWSKACFACIKSW